MMSASLATRGFILGGLASRGYAPLLLEFTPPPVPVEYILHGSLQATAGLTATMLSANGVTATVSAVVGLSGTLEEVP